MGKVLFEQFSTDMYLNIYTIAPVPLSLEEFQRQPLLGGWKQQITGDLLSFINLSMWHVLMKANQHLSQVPAYLEPSILWLCPLVSNYIGQMDPNPSIQWHPSQILWPKQVGPEPKILWPNMSLECGCGSGCVCPSPSPWDAGAAGKQVTIDLP